MRTNYQAKIWRESLLQCQSDMDPLENGWTLDDDGEFSIKWMRCNPAPDEVSIRQVFPYSDNINGSYGTFIFALPITI